MTKTPPNKTTKQKSSKQKSKKTRKKKKPKQKKTSQQTKPKKIKKKYILGMDITLITNYLSLVSEKKNPTPQEKCFSEVNIYEHPIYFS